MIDSPEGGPPIDADRDSPPPARRWSGLLPAAVVFFALADAGLATPFDAGLFACAVGLAVPRLRIPLLLLHASVSDAPGLATPHAYVTFVTLAAIVCLERLSTRAIGGVPWKPGPLVTRALAVVLYAAAMSAAYTLFGGPAQSRDRPFALVAVLTISMIVGASSTALAAQSDPRIRRAARAAVVLALLHALAVTGVQAVTVPEALHSEAGRGLIEEAHQLSSPTSLGFPRLTGPTLAPNSLGLEVALLLLAWLVLSPALRPSTLFVALYGIAGAGASLVTLSKGVLGFFAASVLVVAWHARLRAAIVLGLCATAIAAAGVAGSTNSDDLISSFRAQESAMEVRTLAWDATLRHLSWRDWLLGTGLSHWKVFFERRIAFPLSDPHSWVLSIPGTFGVPGLLFYGFLAAALRATARRASPSVRAVAASLLLVAFLRDLFSIPVVLGNTLLTFQFWFCMAALASPPADVGPGGERTPEDSAP